MDLTAIRRYGDELYEALRGRHTVVPLSEREPDLGIADAYRISLQLLNRRLDSGERIVGKKIGATSEAVQNLLNVHQPDFGYLTDAMEYPNGATIALDQTLIQPRAEGEIAFHLKTRLAGPDVTQADVIRATDYVQPCFEIVDSRIRDWRLTIADTVADNASCGVFVLGEGRAAPEDVPFETVGMRVEKNGAAVSTGVGAAALGSPLTCVAWLANTLSEYGIALEAGETVLSGSLVPLEPVAPGDRMSLTLDGVGTAAVAFR
ncbi:MAG: fumarylacetoacetate hydrolase family protein [Pseudomonadota bacterium]